MDDSKKAMSYICALQSHLNYLRGWVTLQKKYDNEAELTENFSNLPYSCHTHNAIPPGLSCLMKCFSTISAHDIQAETLISCGWDQRREKE